MNTAITQIEYYLPDKILNNLELEHRFPDWNASKIEEKIGIRERRIAADNETALDLAYQASKKILQRIDKDSIDFILLCTQSPDYFLPTSACILQDMLGLKTTVGALDFNLGCSGFVYGLALAKGLINAGIASQVLLVTAETYSKHIHPEDRGNLSIFGDGAAATLISKTECEKILEFDFGTDGKGMNNLIVPNGSLRNRFEPSENVGLDEGGNFRVNNHLFMNGPEIFNFTIESVPLVVKNVLQKNNMVLEKIDYVIFHQANKYMLNYLRKKIKIPKEKFYNNMLFTGNTVSATIPIALKDCLDNKIVKSGDKILLIGFGVGYSWGGTIIEIE
ncbi:MAG: ketoacyl-ACP synthase III [Deltaproteobacteria bacterium]|nr:ketoacyl-ACP synthase III [Deltaproteobacteria bacterium]